MQSHSDSANLKFLHDLFDLRGYACVDVGMSSYIVSEFNVWINYVYILNIYINDQEHNSSKK